ncbi:MAG: SDR family oxidoreductase [Opitutae bacterium]|jgi:L-fucose dehydrogenase|nr:SDR family oxidoreductase [Opitutae bacterium]MBT5717308.1 SDR family oxidoreductase [Opitutae bacterium]
MNLNLQGKVAIVTGGAKGIGAAITRSFAAEGASVSIVDRNPQIANELIQDIGAKEDQLFCIPTELTDENACQNAVQQTIQKKGRIDILIHNAGTNDGVDLKAKPADFFESLRKNLFHVFSLTHFALEELEKNRGTIINIGSKVAETGQGGTSGYAAAKGAMNALTREWALDLAGRGIRVNSVIPAEVMTPMYHRWLDSLKDPEKTLHSIEQNIPFENRMTSDNEIADAVVFLASDRSAHTTGQIFHPDGGYVHLDRSYGKVEID